MSTLDLDRAQAHALLREMLRIRRFEEKCAELYTQEKIRGFLHLYIGEEAIAVGAMAALRDDDAIVSTYREHGHALARGIPAGAVMAEMFGKLNGCAKGRGGSMHLFDASRRFYGGYAIVGGGIPIAVGLALADKMQGRRRVTACFFGDGATAEGEFYEALNLAALWKLPVLFLCENNLYAMGTAIERHAANVQIAPKAAVHGIGVECVDGMDVLEVLHSCRRAADAVRETGEPRFLELRTYRFRAHSMYDAERYRTKEEVAEWKKRDPIALFRARMQASGLLGPDDEAQLESAVASEVNAAVAEAEQGEWEPQTELHRFVYSERVP